MILQAAERQSGPVSNALQTPMVWLGQNLRNRVLLAEHDILKRSPIVISLGDAFLRPSYKDRFFTERLRETLHMEGPIMVDSGGYALLARRSLYCSVKEVAQVYSNLDADILVSLDYPPLPDDDRVVRSRLRRRTLQNLEMLRHTVSPERLMPVVHGHSLKELRRACEDVGTLCPQIQLEGIS
jgi:hypothetical protein